MGLDILSQVQQANAQAAQSGYLAQVARNNQEMQRRTAEIQELNARRAELQGVADEDRRRRETASRIGSERAGLASQGGDINDGSAPDLVGDIAREGELEALGTRDEARRRAWAYRLLGMNADNQAGLAEAEGANEWRRAGEAQERLRVGIGRTLLGSATSLVRGWPL